MIGLFPRQITVSEPSAERLEEQTVLRRWIRREAMKDQYPNARPRDWSRERLLTELTETYDEPARWALADNPTWIRKRVSGSTLGGYNHWPGSSWDPFSDSGQVSDVVDRLSRDRFASKYPDFYERVQVFRHAIPDTDLGALVGRITPTAEQPTLLDGNHRSLAAHWEARADTVCELEVHLAIP